MSFSLINAFNSFFYALVCSVPIGCRCALHQLCFPFSPSTALFLNLSPPTGGSCGQYGSQKRCRRLIETHPAELIGSWVKQSHFLGSLPGKLCKHLRESRRHWSLHWDTSNLTAQNLFAPLTLLFF